VADRRTRWEGGTQRPGEGRNGARFRFDLIESDRVLIRAVAGVELSEADLADRRAVLNSAAAHWHILRLDAAIVERARRPFPLEPIRTLDAIHLASALSARALVPGLALLTLDERIRSTALRLGFQLSI
jgi:predicted nucleic acid-binding protein